LTLKLSLKPGERIVINGAVIANGDRRSEFAIENLASVLREKDILAETDANTPAKRIYFSIMVMALGNSTLKQAFAEFESRLTEFAGVIVDPAGLQLCLKISACVANADYYKALNHCKALIEFEQERLNFVA